MEKTYYVIVNFSYDFAKHTAKPVSVVGSYFDGKNKDSLLVERNKDDLLPVLVDYIMTENYGAVRDMLKVHYNINVDDCELELEKNI